MKAHTLKMIEWIEKLATLGFVMDHDLCVDFILQSLPESYSQFVMNYNMNKIEGTFENLFNMLKTAESTMKKEKGHVMLVGKTNKRKGKKLPDKGKGKKVPKAKKSKKDITKKDKEKCFHYG